MELKNKTAVITGGTSGIGLASAEQFRLAGAKVICLARHPSQQAVDIVGSEGKVVVADVTERATLDRAFQRVARDFGSVDVLMINAAQVQLSPIAETDEALYDDLMAVNCKGAFVTLQAALPHLAPAASVIVTTSWLNRIGFAGSSVTSMTKAALRSLVRVAARELAPRKIRVNALCPGAIETPLWSKLGLPKETLAQAGAQITAQVPLGRWGSAAEVAQAALFLASSASSYINGTELQVDGGLEQV